MSRRGMNHLPKEPKVSLFWKYLLFGYNSVFWLLGSLLVAVGLWAWSQKGVLGSDLSSMTDLGLLDPVWLCLAVGAVMFVLGFAGSIGALRENTYLLRFLEGSLTAILFALCVAVPLVFMFSERITGWVDPFFQKGIRAYRDDADLQNFIDFVQGHWRCCGTQGPDDWNLNVYFNCTDAHNSTERCGVPFSCCDRDPADEGGVVDTQCGYGAREHKADGLRDPTRHIYTSGCVEEIKLSFTTNWQITLIVISVFGAVNFIGMSLAMTLLNQIARVKSRWVVTPAGDPPERSLVVHTQ